MHHRSKIYTLLFFFLIAVKICFAQHPLPADADSLIALLKNSSDTTKTRILNMLSTKYYDKVPEKSIDYANQAILLSQQNKSNSDLGRSYLNLGRGYYSKGEYEEALNNFLTAKKIFQTINNRLGIADVFLAMASVYTDLGNYESSLNYNLQALTIREELNDSTAMSSSLINIGLVYYKLKKLDVANGYYHKSLKIRELRKDEAGIASCYNNIGNVYSDKGDNEKALEYFQKSLIIKERLGNKKGVAATFNNIGSVYTNMKNYPKAREYFLRSYGLKVQVGDQLGIASSLSNIGGNYYFMNDRKNAIKYFLQAIDVAKQIKASEVILTNYKNVAEAYYEDGDYKKSSDYYSMENDLKDSVYNVEGAKSMSEMQARFDFEKQEKELKISKQKNDIQDLELSRQRIFKNAFIIGFVLLLIIVFVIYNRYQVKHKANAKLQIQKREIIRQHKELNIAYSQIETKNKDITDSIRYAKRLQLAILPTTEFERTFRQNGFIIYKPKDIVSGDFYWMGKKNNKILIAAVDSTGHGVPGAFMSIVGYNLLNQAVNEHHITQPSLILDEMNKGVTDTLRQYEEESTVKDGMDLALCSIDMEKMELQFAGAYNPLWLMRNGELTEIAGNKFPVGAFIGETINTFSNHTIQLQKNDMIYLFTDGFADQFGGVKGKKFKYKQFQKLFSDNCDKMAADQKLIFERSFENWIGKLDQVDDVLVIGIKI